MATTGKINPAFQAAPFFGASSFDPVEFAKRQGMLKEQDKRVREAKTAKNTVEGLDKLMVDLKAWDDKAGLKEITDRQRIAKEVFMDATKKGVNVFNPTTPEEIQLFKATTDYLNETKQLADMRNAQGVRWGVFQKAAMEDAQNPNEDERLINYNETLKKGQEILGDNSIMGRGSKLDNFLVLNPQIGDVDKWQKESVDPYLNKPTLTTNQWKNPDGTIGSRAVTDLTPDQETDDEKIMRQKFRAMPSDIKNGLEREKKRDPSLEVMPLEDYYVMRYNKQFARKFVNTLKGNNSFGFNFLGSTAKVAPGEFQDNELKLGDRTYGDRWQLDSKPIYKVPTAGGMRQDWDGKWLPIGSPGLAEANVIAYVPETDEVIFRTTSSSETPEIGANATFSVPRKVLKDLEKYPVTFPNGKPGTLKDVMPEGGTTPTTKKLPVNWSKPVVKPYIPKKQ